MILLGLLACHPHPRCADDETRRNGRCWPYLPSDPEPNVGWRPEPGTPWQIQHTPVLDDTVDVDLYAVDLFTVEDEEVTRLREQGRWVLCAVAVGWTFLDAPDADRFPEWTLGEEVPDVDGARWVDVTTSVVQGILRDRVLLAGERGCHAVDLVGADAWEHDTGLELTATMSADAVRLLADTAHRNGLAAGLRDDVAQAAELLPWFDLALSVGCVVDGTCDAWSTFTDVDRPVLHVELVDDWGDAEQKATEVCGRGPALDTLIKPAGLGPERLACPD